jgi:hypothetical protein
MKTFLTIAIAILFFSFNLPGNQEPTPKALQSSSNNQKGWKQLFDGKSKAGWHIYSNDEGNGSNWKVQDGVLMYVPYLDKTSKIKRGGDLVTDNEYENYHFSVEWKISEGGNSGIIFGVNEAPEFEHTFHTGMEMQVLDNDRHSDAKIIKHRAGDLYDLVSSSKETVKPVGEWNLADIIYNKGELKLFLNGENVVTTVVGDENWNKMVAGSKFKKMPGFGKSPKGRIALQDHGNAVWYRNVRIKEL